MTKPPKLYSIARAAEVIGISARQLYRLVEANGDAISVPVDGGTPVMLFEHLARAKKLAGAVKRGRPKKTAAVSAAPAPTPATHPPASHPSSA